MAGPSGDVVPISKNRPRIGEVGLEQAKVPTPVEPMRYAEVPLEFNIASHFLDRNAGDRTALITDAGPCSYAELATLTNRVGNVLRSLGVRPGDRVLIAVNDSVEFVATWYGTQKIGAVTAEVYCYLQAKDYRYYLDYVQPAIVVADAATVPRLREAGAAKLLVLGLAPEQLRPAEYHFESLVAEQCPELEAV